MRTTKTPERYEEVAKRIEDLVYDHPGCTSLLIGSKAGYSEGGVYRILQRMIREGRLVAKTEGDNYYHHYLPLPAVLDKLGGQALIAGSSFTPEDRFLQNYEEVETYEPDEVVPNSSQHAVNQALSEYEQECVWWGAEPSYDKFRSWVEKHL